MCETKNYKYWKPDSKKVFGGDSLVPMSCLSLCNPMDYSPPSFSVHKIFQARILERVALPFSKETFPTQGSNSCLLHCRFFTD